MIRKLVADYAQDQVVVVFDAKGPTFRNRDLCTIQGQPAAHAR